MRNNDVAMLYRMPHEDQFSIESYFERVQVDLQLLGFETRKLTASARSQGLINRVKILAQMAGTRFNLVHITGDITFAALACKGPVIITIHDVQILNRVSGLRRAILKYFWFDWPIRRAAVVTVNSEETARRLRAEISAARNKRLHVIPVSVADEFEPPATEFYTERPTILQIGTKENKNVPRLLKAISGLNCRLKIVGPISASLRSQLKDSKIEYENLRDLTQLELLETYRKSDLLAFVSTEEGFGMPILEAQRIGVPVVTSKVSSMPEVAGEGACFVDPLDEKSIREGINRVIEEATYREAIVRRGLENVARFDRKSIAQDYLRIYECILGLKGCQTLADTDQKDVWPRAPR